MVNITLSKQLKQPVYNLCLSPSVTKTLLKVPLGILLTVED